MLSACQDGDASAFATCTTVAGGPRLLVGLPPQPPSKRLLPVAGGMMIDDEVAAHRKHAASGADKIGDQGIASAPRPPIHGVSSVEIELVTRVFRGCSIQVSGVGLVDDASDDVPGVPRGRSRICHMRARLYDSERPIAAASRPASQESLLVSGTGFSHEP